MLLSNWRHSLESRCDDIMYCRSKGYLLPRENIGHQSDSNHIIYISGDWGIDNVTEFAI